MTEPLLTVTEVAELVKLDAEVVRRAIRDRELRASKLRGKLRVRSSDVDAWVDACVLADDEQPPEPAALPTVPTGSSLDDLMRQHGLVA